MLKLSISFIIIIYVFISPVLQIKGHLTDDDLEKEFLSIISELEIEASKLAVFKEMKVTKMLTAFHSNEKNVAIHLIGMDQILHNLIDYFPHDKSFLIVKKYQSNYLS
ncbi:hypothetical protein [Metabacillus sp. Hm71]|uniref:hypothetical protein n=1 Tax=Metabacillus sp. Hm71 TaxID=3450743 RepID=UPI003F43090B